MNKYFFVLFSLMLMFGIAMGQDNEDESETKDKRQEEEAERKPFKDRIFFGGNFGLQFGNSTFIDISPLVGYRITEKFSAGVGVTYQFIQIKYNTLQGTQKFSTYNVGGRVFGRHLVFKNIYAHGEYESLSVEYLDATQADRFQRGWVPGLFLGGALIQPLGKRSAIGVTLLYNFLYNPNRSPYNSPVVLRAGIML